MWMLQNKTVYSAERNWTRDKNGVHLWLVALRATFVVDARGNVQLNDEQPPPPLAPEYHGAPGASSMRLDSDLLYLKPVTDIVLDATAHAPRARPVQELTVGMQVGKLSKQLRVFGDRVYVRRWTQLGTSDPLPFCERSVRYEEAFGGADRSGSDPRLHRCDARNPLGRGVAREAASLVGQRAHTIEAEGAAEATPAGFGPLDASWSPRRERAGTYDESWQRTRSPLLAEDYQELFASSAPDDQRVAHLHGGEPVALTHLTAEGVLQFTLPKIYPAFTTFFGNRQKEHRAKLTTLFIEPEARRFSLTWQTSLAVGAHQIEYLDRTLIREKRYV